MILTDRRSAITLAILTLLAAVLVGVQNTPPAQAVTPINVITVDCTPLVDPRSSGNVAPWSSNTMGMALAAVDTGGLFNVTEVTPAAFRAMTSAQLGAYDLIAINNHPGRLRDRCNDYVGPGGLGTAWHSAVGVNNGGRVVLSSHDFVRFKMNAPTPGPPYLTGFEPFGARDFVRQAALWAGGVPGQTGLVIFNDAANGFFVPLGGWGRAELGLPPAWGIADAPQTSASLIACGGHTDILPAFGGHPVYAGLNDLRAVPGSISSASANISDGSFHSVFRAFNGSIFTATEQVINSAVADPPGGPPGCLGGSIAGPDGLAITLIREARSSLTVVKDALPEDDSPFDFLVGPAGGPVAYSFQLMDPSDNTWTQDVQPGRWRVAENLQTLPAGRWFFRGGVCKDLNNPREPEVVITAGARFAAATIQVDAGDRWRCVFSNREWAQVEIFKQARTEFPLTDPDVRFPFRTDIPEGPVNFTLADGESIVFDMVPEGTHNVVEQQGAMPPRWFLTGIGCDDAGKKHRADVDTGLLRLNLTWGDEIRCRFVNEEGFLDIEKWTNGHDADQMPGPEIPVGEPITWKYIVTNRGPEPITNISVVDDKLGPIACPKTTLAPGESMTCTAQGTAHAGQYKNVGTATGFIGDDQYSNSDPSHYFGLQGDYDLKIVKRGPSYAAPYSTVTYEYYVTNQYWGSAVAPVVTDDKCAPVTYHSGDWNDDGLVQFGEVWKFTCDYQVGGPFQIVVNIATVGPLDQDLNPDDNQAWWWMPVVPWAGGFRWF